ncbi:hypothetical protein [Wolbachia endosymbiont of Ctenocephalides felis wCfeT]|uniref:hypothetical protein n=1 Tax=Wolbachia endosymbiont of Ctenocephalides felis wCfeT TaxID=2732593 RepID=UPI00144786BE|nr:hypothetical protein [Wolbachia endosymbiont of Ctenocephalides felis wCfeT]
MRGKTIFTLIKNVKNLSDLNAALKDVTAEDLKTVLLAEDESGKTLLHMLFDSTTAVDYDIVKCIIEKLEKFEKELEKFEALKDILTAKDSGEKMPLDYLVSNQSLAGSNLGLVHFVLGKTKKCCDKDNQNVKKAEEEIGKMDSKEVKKILANGEGLCSQLRKAIQCGIDISPILNGQSKENINKALAAQYCWNNTLLHSAVRHSEKNGNNVAILLNIAKKLQITKGVLSKQMRWEEKGVDANRHSEADNNFLHMSPLALAIYEENEDAIRAIESIDKVTAYTALAQDIKDHSSSTHEKKEEFRNKVSRFTGLRSDVSGIGVVRNSLKSTYPFRGMA